MYMTFGKQLGIEYTGLSGKITDEVFVRTQMDHILFIALKKHVPDTDKQLFNSICNIYSSM